MNLDLFAISEFAIADEDPALVTATVEYGFAALELNAIQRVTVRVRLPYDPTMPLAGLRAAALTKAREVLAEAASLPEQLEYRSGSLPRGLDWTEQPLDQPPVG